jgi:hypothetical protein
MDQNPNTDEPQKPRRRWFQFRDDVRMLRFVVDRSYIWLFFAFATIFVLGGVACQILDRPHLDCLSMPVFGAFLLWSELRSGVALDSWWRASHPKGTRYFYPMIVWHFIGFLLLTLFSCGFIGAG